ncbi:SNF2 family N-terminal domain-containing protein [Desulfacinum infernum DSM 9756]|uniref:SNF2 family N-terminal domain-containing protein n=1 Tax=Desulfacinum infernum DSM 9756 TaxID=1121391 RepID=A0A1M5IXR5_9BACT|nr:DISARM system SNF2-like helicase DrmD [Desulfacinum infernum]SHG33104.1 SNF2 family N-terminal domain-containing protein [Desulfacinum infernum DSM 9756]
MPEKERADSSEYVWSKSVPDPGQLVEIRRRHWIVSDVQDSAFSSTGNGRQHLVTLGSLDEDSLGENIQILWELEPGARVLERAGLPKITGWDSAEKLEAFLDAVRWGAATNADRSFLQSPFRSGITIEDYQLDPLVRAIDMARVNLLIADDVGLGKTIEAGLVIQELLVRHRARTVIIVCPATLQVKWRTEMQEKFGLEFRIVDTEYIKTLRRERGIHANPWTSFPRLISSMDWMKSGEGLRLLKDVLPPRVTYPRMFDILVVDEAHNVAPAAASRYVLESQRTRLIRTIAPHFTHRLFLSATPHNGYQESFTSLLELLDDQRFARTVMPDEKQLHRVMVRRMKSDIVDPDGRPVFPVRKLKCLEVDYSDEERSIHRLLREFTESRAKSVKGTRYEFGTDFVHILLKKRLFSSPMAFAVTLAKHRETLERGRSARDAATLDDRILRKAIVRTEEEYSDDAKAEEAQLEAVEVASELAVPLTDDERTMLNRLTDWAEKHKNRVDAKARAILDWIEAHLKTDGQWNEKRVILFTEYRATHVWLQQILTANGYGGDRLMILHGSMRPHEREAVKAAFQAHPSVSPVRILLATDAASEGIDLQNHCNYLIHVEIPWNPNVMEQRNGRIDRHGQKEKEVYIWHPVGKGFDPKDVAAHRKVGDIAGDHEYLMRAVLKVNTIREDLGSVGPVIAKQIEEAMLGRRATMDTSQAEAKAARARRFVAAERKLRERIARLHGKLMEAETDFRLAPENVHRAVAVALELAEKPPLKPASLPGVPDGKVFEVPVLPGSWGRATAGLEHPHTGVRRPITFDHEVAKGRDDVVLVHLNHKLVQMSLRLLREEIWKLDDVKLLHRVTVRSVPDGEIARPVVAIWSRLVVTGGGHHRLHEELTLSGGELEHDVFRRITRIRRLEALTDMAIPVDPSDALFAVLKDRFERHEEAIRHAVEARSRERLRYLHNTLNRRKESEIGDLIAVLDELEKSIRKELEDSGPRFVQLTLWPVEERNQLKRDLESLKARLARIPDEKKKETAAIESRYADPMARTFPVAVVFIVPRSMLGEDRTA